MKLFNLSNNLIKLFNGPTLRALAPDTKESELPAFSERLTLEHAESFLNSLLQAIAFDIIKTKKSLPKCKNDFIKLSFNLDKSVF